MRFLSAVGLILVLSVAGAVGFAYSGLPSVAATTDDSGPLRWLLKTTRQHSIERRAAEIVAPELSERVLVVSGATAFDEMCARCHGAPGRDPFLGARDMNPPPPDLGEVAGKRSPSALFWMIKHGIRMTGMPAWGATHSDDQLWEMVAFIKQLPALSAADYRRLADQGTADNHQGHHHQDHLHAVSDDVERHHHDH
ncbi:MAG: cytochrome c [Chromatiaceae bacterium]